MGCQFRKSRPFVIGDVIRDIQRVQAVHADEQYVLDSVIIEAVVGLDSGRHSCANHSERKGCCEKFLEHEVLLKNEIAGHE